MLRDFVAAHRNLILAEARSRVFERSGKPSSDGDRARGLPVFLDQLCESLRRASGREERDHTDLQQSAGEHGHALFHHGLTIDQVVHDYGDLCQVITGLAVAQGDRIATDEFRTLNLCLDDAIAGAVTAYARERDSSVFGQGSERLGLLAHEMRNLVNGAIVAFASIKRGVVAPGGSTGALLDRSLMQMSAHLDRSLALVRLDSATQKSERVFVRELLEQVEISAGLVAKTRGLRLEVTAVDLTVVVETDRQILAAAVGSMLQNAFEFTSAGSTVKLTACATADRVLIEVEDACGGLPIEKSAKLLRPFIQEGSDIGGLGLGMTVLLRALKCMAGELHIRDLPGKGCVFSIDLPRQSPPPLRLIRGDQGQASPGSGAGHAVGQSR